MQGLLSVLEVVGCILSNGQILPSCIKTSVKCFGKNFSLDVKIDGFFHPEAVECHWKTSCQS